jgi:Flp pilus assembly protein CpaB
MFRSVHLRRLPRRLRVALATRPLAYWSLTALVAAGVAYAAFGVATSAAEARAGYGTVVPTLVATAAIAPGQALTDDDTEIRVLPAALVAVGALHSRPPGGVASQPIAAGEPVVALRVGRGGDGPVAALLPDGTRGIAVPADGTGLPLRPGDHVDVVAAVASGAGGAARVVAHDAVVAHVGDRSVVVAVTVADAPAVAQALADGAVVLALSAGR